MEPIFGLILPLIALIFLIFFLFTASSAIQQRYGDKAAATSNDSNNPDEDEKDVSKIAVASAIHTYRKRRDAHEYDRAQRENTTIIVLSLTGAFALLAAGAAIVSGWIFWGQLGEMQQANRDTHAALVEVQRAFIVISALAHESLLDDNGQLRGWRFIPTIGNYGNTPTSAMTAVTVSPSEYWMVEKEEMSMSEGCRDPKCIDARDASIGAPLDPETIFSSHNPLFMLPYFVLPPKGTTVPPGAYTFEYEVTFKNIEDSMSGRFGRFFFGAVRYTDIFNKQHISKYCFRIDAIVMGRPGERQPRSSQCNHWNCVDKQCDQDRQSYDVEIARWTNGRSRSTR